MIWCSLPFPAFESDETVVNDHKSISFSPRSDDLGANGVGVLETGLFGYHAGSSKHRALSFHAIGTSDSIVNGSERSEK